MKASDLFVKCLEEEGVEYVFAVPGEENLHLLESLRTSAIKVIVNRHEQGSAFMAATYGRLTGRPGVCLATLGPGATNLVTGIAFAQLGGMPLVAITGQKGIRENGQAGFQVVDVVRMMEPITKRSVQVRNPQAIPKEVRESFKEATAERRGSCHIELPEDIAAEDVADAYRPQTPTRIRGPAPDADALTAATEMIRAAQNPIILVSSRAQRARVRERLRELCDRTDLYVIHTQLGKGVLGDDHPNSLYSFGIHKRDYVHCGVDKADLIITVGYSAIEYPPSVWNRDLDKKILHIDFTPAYHDIYYAPDGELVGDIATSLQLLSQGLGSYRQESGYYRGIKGQLDTMLFIEGSQDDAFPPRPQRIVADCRKVLGTGDIVCLDNGIYKLWFSKHYKTFDVGTFLVDNSLASMGAGLPSAMAAKLVRPERRVLAVCGDGGFMMNSQEMETAVRLGLNVVVLILNDNAYGFIKWKQSTYGYPNFAMDLPNPDFVKYAESYGARGFRVNSAEELAPILERAFGEAGPVIVECPIDYSENSKVWGEDLDGIVCPM